MIVKDLRKSFRSPGGQPLEVLRGVSFTVDDGEMIAVMGASGAGKSTLLHILGGLEKASGGSARVSDFKITNARSDTLSKYRNETIGFVFQFHHLLPDLSAEENVAMPLAIRRRNWRESLRLASEALDSVGLRERKKHLVGDLSGGEQQRVAFARAIVTKPKLILADEPTGNLDAATGDEIGSLLASYMLTHRAMIVIATHNARLANLCHRVLRLEDGRITEEAIQTSV